MSEKNNSEILDAQSSFGKSLSQKSWSLGTILILKVCFSSNAIRRQWAKFLVINLITSEFQYILDVFYEFI